MRNIINRLRRGTASVRRRFSELSAAAFLMIKHGMRAACLLTFAGLAARVYGGCTGDCGAARSLLSESLIEAGVAVAAEVIIGGLLLDYLLKKHGKA